MGYSLEALICKDTLSSIITNEFKSAKRICLVGDLFLIPYNTDLYEEVNCNKLSVVVDKFEFLNDTLFNYLLSESFIEPIAYIEADYFGGTGGQSAILLDKGEIVIDIRFSDSGYGAVNLVLKEFGVTKGINADEWDTVGLLRHRSTEEWIEINQFDV